MPYKYAQHCLFLKRIVENKVEWTCKTEGTKGLPRRQNSGIVWAPLGLNRERVRLQVLVYCIRPRNTAITAYPKCLLKLSNASTFVTDNSNYARSLFSNYPHCLQNQNRLNRDGTLFFFFTRGRTRLMFRACFDAMLIPHSDSVGRQTLCSFHILTVSVDRRYVHSTFWQCR